MKTVRIVMGLSLCVALGGLAGSGEFPLRVDDVSGLDAPWPLVGGLPFLRGELTDAAQVRILQGDTEIPAQIDVASRWPDGSIRWALVGLNASPQGDYRVEYGPGVSRAAPEHPLTLERDADGGLTVDTGAAVYRFAPDALLPQRAEVNGVTVLDNAGDGAYLIDNHGRVARVAGARAEIETAILRQGPVRTVIRREGWYVTGDGSQIARAKIWFYLTAGSPYLRITHSLVLTEDTNALWVRDYGLEFSTPAAPQEVVFGLSEPAPSEGFRPRPGGHAWMEHRRELAELFHSGLHQREQRLFTVTPGEDEVYMLQDRYPHVLERDFRAVIARAPADQDRCRETGIAANNFWINTWLKRVEVAGDWGKGSYDGFGLSVVVPQLAQQFPKEISFGPRGARVALWSGRSGRELDFRAVTLINEFWQRWAEDYQNSIGGHPADVTELVHEPSNAQGTAHTHDVWLMPGTGAADAETLKRLASAASHRPLPRAAPAWLCESRAIGWPLHPYDAQRHGELESILETEWDYLRGGPAYNAGLRRTGRFMWGAPPNLRGYNAWFRFSHYSSGDYHLSANVWPLYARGGDRSYYEYGSRFNRWQGDFDIVHWTGGGKRKGEHVTGPPYRGHLPFYWGKGRSYHPESRGRIRNWLTEYYLSGNEHALEIVNMIGDAFRNHWDIRRQGREGFHGILYLLGGLREHDGADERLREIADEVLDRMIDEDNPTGLNDDIWYGVFYKATQELMPLALYYQTTGDARARDAVLKFMDYKFRFNVQDRTNMAGRRHGLACQHFGTFLWSMAYDWTGERKYLRKVNHMLASTRHYEMGHRFGPIINQMNLFSGVPVAMQVLANFDESDKPIEPFPLLAVRVPELTRSFDTYEIAFRIEEDASLPPVVFEKPAGQTATLSIAIRIADRAPADTEAKAVLTGPDGKQPEGAHFRRERFFMTANEGRRDPRRWHFAVTVPADAPAGEYRLEFPDAGAIYVMESDAADIRLPGAPDRPTTIPRTRSHKIRYQ